MFNARYGRIMKTTVQVTAVSVIGFVLFGVALFWPAGTFDYWQAWVFLGVFIVLGRAYTIYHGYREYTRRVRSRLVPYVW
jgi:hypothetical protein